MATKTKSLTTHPSSLYSSSNMTITNADLFIGNGSDNDEYCSCSIAKTKGATGTVSWSFDLSVVPKNAEIESVTCDVTFNLNDMGYILSGSTYAALCSGETQKGYGVSIWTSTKTTSTINETGNWTRDELQYCSLFLQAKRDNSNYTKNRYLYLYGADLTVTYTYQSEKFMLKLGGSWAGAARVFKKVSGIWVEQEELANVVEDGVRYKNGGEIESIAPPVTLISFTIDGTSYQAEEGMTWAEWVASSYNTIGAYISTRNSLVIYPHPSWGDCTVWDAADNKGEYSSDTIKSGYAYTIA